RMCGRIRFQSTLQVGTESSKRLRIWMIPISVVPRCSFSRICATADRDFVAAPNTVQDNHMNLHQLSLFCRVAEGNSFSAASRDLYLSQPAISNQIKRLEQSLGLELIGRRGNRISLSREGEQLFAFAKSLLEQVDYIERQMANLRAGESGKIILGV